MELKIYSNIVANLSKDKQFSVRKSIVLEALEKGIKPTARRFSMSKNTIRTWIRRFQSEGNDGLMDRRSGPKNIPHKTSKEEEEHIMELRKRVACYGARRLKHEFQLKPSIGAIQRVLHSRGMTSKKKRRYQKKNDLRAIKAARYKALEKMEMDVKYLTDIPPYWEMMEKFRLPRFQYTVRDVKSGMLFLGFADEVSVLNAETMLRHVLGTIAPYFPGNMIIQTDNGVEFSGTTRRHENNHFRNAVNSFGAEHIYIPPGHCNANADVETIHATIEEEFYNLIQCGSRMDFLKKAESYRLFYNLQRLNYSKGAKTPWLITQQDHPALDLASIAQSVNVVDLDHLLKPTPLGGQPLPVLPVMVKRNFFTRNDFYMLIFQRF
jgi:transposase